MMKKRVLISWSSGKDSAWTLHLLQQRDDVEVVGLVTTVDEQSRQVAIHSTHESWLEKQAESIGLPLYRTYLPMRPAHDVYAQGIADLIGQTRHLEVSHWAMGDLFLSDIRKYREALFHQFGMPLLFPLWKLDTHQLACEMISQNLKTTIASVDTTQLDASFAGRKFDLEFLAELPSSVDPCGENGEFHTLVTDGPMFKQSIPLPDIHVDCDDRFAFYFNRAVD
ncbi:diphthine--ammonia ligase [Pleionea sp. CnH1-48]|uniref:Dph6-related ATP pyrophosphatase n=1 Tax=Pleionea sp. CnH1-48 TaxID=2954494 RepID=UPI0020969F67|nr:diphthine--ammonia ligase [Pleionea sp. CnH1-48]MCO7225245.1 diphthine--ammonia ligase [Pleionea sp. CnH1-48]